MKKSYILLLFVLFMSGSVYAQQDPLARFEPLIGKWNGHGEGFGSTKSKISAEYSWLMNKQFIQVKHRSEFEPTEKKPEGEIHEDMGIVSFDKERKAIVFRQYHIEGFYNEYVLSDSLSSEEKLVFETEKIENFVPGGKARFTIQLRSSAQIETLFDVGFPGKEMTCFGRNILLKEK